MDMYFMQDLAEELGVDESELWRAWNACQTPEARLRRLRRQLADIPDGATEYVPVSVWGANPQFVSRKTLLRLKATED